MGVVPKKPGTGAVELRIEALAAGGRGVARSQGVVWFLPEALPGDRVRAEPRRRHRRYIEGRVLERLEGSPARRPAPCPIQGGCGGCPWMPLEEMDQRRWKRRLVEEALRRIGHSDVEVEPVRVAPAALGYRNRVEFTLGRDADGRPAIGLHPSDPDRPGVVDVERCLLLPEVAHPVLETARGLLLERAGDWLAAGGVDPFRMTLRVSRHRGEVLVLLRETTRPFPVAKVLAQRLQAAHPAVVGVVRVRARTGQRGGTRATPIVGRSWISERIGELELRLPATSFVQVDTEAAGMLVDLVVQHAGVVDGKVALDLYGGVGGFGIALARRGARVTVCEADAEAVRCGRQAARSAGVPEVTFVHAEVESHLRTGEQGPRGVDVVVANPPRAGLGRRVPEGIRRQDPERIVLVSCDPATLARDLSRLVKLGYAPERAIPVDLFPQTAHVETVLPMKKRGQV
jgi:23S rRNA (uracil1939-C5)-methyltransferase